ncbi:tetratricopeptide repeat protein [Thermodesulfobacteriota bacterium]
MNEYYLTVTTKDESACSAVAPNSWPEAVSLFARTGLIQASGLNRQVAFLEGGAGGKVTNAVVAVSMLIVVSLLTPASGNATDEVAKHFQKSFRYEDYGNNAAALNAVIKILQTDPGNYTASLRAGWLYCVLGYHNDSIVQYRKAISLEPTAVEPRLGLVLPLMASKRWKEAAAAARDALDIDKKNYTANSRLAFSLYSMGEYHSAARVYRQILKLYPSNIEMQLGLAWTYAKMGRRSQARRWFKRVLSVRRFSQSALAGMEATYGRTAAGRIPR